MYLTPGIIIFDVLVPRAFLEIRVQSPKQTQFSWTWTMSISLKQVRKYTAACPTAMTDHHMYIFQLFLNLRSGPKYEKYFFWFPILQYFWWPARILWQPLWALSDYLCHGSHANLPRMASEGVRPQKGWGKQQINEGKASNSWWIEEKRHSGEKTFIPPILHMYNLATSPSS